MTPEEFKATYASLVERLAEITGLDKNLFLAQFAADSGWGNSQLAQVNNFAKIKYDGGWYGSTLVFGEYAAYPNEDQFEQDYLRILGAPFYENLKASAGQPLAAQISALGESPWDAGHYGDPPGSALLAFVGQDVQESVTLSVPTGEFRWYTVKDGDTLQSVAQAELADDSKYIELFEINSDRLVFPGFLTPGQQIRIPISGNTTV